MGVNYLFGWKSQKSFVALKWPCRTGSDPSCTQTHGVQLTWTPRNPSGLPYEPEPKAGSTHSLLPFLRLAAGDSGETDEQDTPFHSAWHQGVCSGEGRQIGLQGEGKRFGRPNTPGQFGHRTRVSRPSLTFSRVLRAAHTRPHPSSQVCSKLQAPIHLISLTSRPSGLCTRCDHESRPEVEGGPQGEGKRSTSWRWSLLG